MSVETISGQEYAVIRRQSVSGIVRERNGKYLKDERPAEFVLVQACAAGHPYNKFAVGFVADGRWRGARAEWFDRAAAERSYGFGP